MTLTRIDHVQLAISDGGEALARRFWVDLLGLFERPKPPGQVARGGCRFEGGGVAVLVGIERPIAPARKAHPAFCVCELEALAVRLSKAGYELTGSEDVPSRRLGHTADPFGNRIELIAEGEGFSQRP